MQAEPAPRIVSVTVEWVRKKREWRRDCSGKNRSFRRNQEQREVFEQLLILTATRKQTSASASTSGFPVWPERWGKAMNQPTRSFSTILLGRAPPISLTLIQPHERKNSCTGKRWLHYTQELPLVFITCCTYQFCWAFDYFTHLQLSCTLLFNKPLFNEVLDYTPHW